MCEAFHITVSHGWVTALRFNVIREPPNVIPAAIDWTFRISDIMAVIGFAGGGIGGAILLTRNVDKLTGRTEVVEDKIDGLSQEIKRVAEILNIMGRFEERTASLQKQVDTQQRQLEDLRNGRGWIVEPPHGAGARPR